METTNSLKKVFYFLLVALTVFLFGYFSFQPTKISSPREENSIQYVKIGGQTIKTELALTQEAQTLGLSGRKGIAEGTGMLFVFPKPGKNYFWMKEMKFPIDIVWLDENLKIIYIAQSVSPESYPATFGPEKESQYVLEISAGFAEKNNLQENDQVEFLP
jgi:uncharacterized membrane protein (UPF0127 family)